MSVETAFTLIAAVAAVSAGLKFAVASANGKQINPGIYRLVAVASGSMFAVEMARHYGDVPALIVFCSTFLGVFLGSVSRSSAEATTNRNSISKAGGYRRDELRFLSSALTEGESR